MLSFEHRHRYVARCVQRHAQPPLRTSTLDISDTNVPANLTTRAGAAGGILSGVTVFTLSTKWAQAL